MRKSKRRPTPTGVTLATILLSVTPLAACSSAADSASYPIPDNICGIATDSAILEQLLDEGDELVQDANHFPLRGDYICHMYVDGNDSVVGDATWQESGYTLRDHFEYSGRKGIHYFGGGKYASWKSGVATVIPCSGVNDMSDVVVVTVEDIRWNEDSRALLEKIGPPYFDAYKKKLGCPS
ncbi:hypothetical protein ACH4NV_31305 [Streptomyces althioticus]|uniref:hypothetical protein n=1 Tax=Streptomyces althioticus group TaxID=2867194 RepID=UPI00177F4E2C|nr:hypothetical protein GCM10010267_63630 [Streptomyces griseorubens]